MRDLHPRAARHLSSDSSPAPACCSEAGDQSVQITTKAFRCQLPEGGGHAASLSLTGLAVKYSVGMSRKEPPCNSVRFVDVARLACHDHGHEHSDRTSPERSRPDRHAAVAAHRSSRRDGLVTTASCRRMRTDVRRVAVDGGRSRRPRLGREDPAHRGSYWLRPGLADVGRVACAAAAIDSTGRTVNPASNPHHWRWSTSRKAPEHGLQFAGFGASDAQSCGLDPVAPEDACPSCSGHPHTPAAAHALHPAAGPAR